MGFLLAAVAYTDPPLFRYRHWVEVQALYVVQGYRRQGAARRLMTYTYTWARQQGFNRIQLFVTTSNFGAKTFYAREGFIVSQEILRKSLS